MKEYTVLLSDWTDERPYEVQRSLHYATDWYAIRKGSTQDYGQAIRHGYLRTKLTNEWKRMLPMDVSDVAYDRFLVNGSREELAAGGACGGYGAATDHQREFSSTYWWVRYAGGKMRVVAGDGKDVEPIAVDRMIIGVSETYDVLVTVPGFRKL
jgi:FtsP/CotA-like multicopper oxidase with cupredoxin domain